MKATLYVLWIAYTKHNSILIKIIIMRSAFMKKKIYKFQFTALNPDNKGGTYAR